MQTTVPHAQADPELDALVAKVTSPLKDTDARVFDGLLRLAYQRGRRYEQTRHAATSGGA